MAAQMNMAMKIWGVLSMGALLAVGCAPHAKIDDQAKSEEQGQEIVVPKDAGVPKAPREPQKTVNVPPPTPRTTEEVSVQPVHQEAFVPKMPGVRVSQVSVPGNYVALTFDDGPSAAYTPQVLDILKRYGAKATFFVLGQCAVRNKGLLARAAAEGHEIGAHTWSHIKMTGSNDAKILSEMDRTNAVIEEATGRRPAVMRPPYGATNGHIMSLMMSRYGMPSIMWSVDTQDWKHPGVGVVVQRAVNRAQRGSIILLHDIHASTLAAVEGVVSGLQRRGFQLVTVSELIRMGKNAAHAAGLAAQPLPAEAPAPESAPAAVSPAEAMPTAVVPAIVAPAPESDHQTSVSVSPGEPAGENVTVSRVETTPAAVAAPSIEL